MPVEVIGWPSWVYALERVDWPAWVQAIGSLLAVGAAVLVFILDLLSRKGERKRARSEAKSARLDMIERAQLALGSAAHTARLLDHNGPLPATMPRAAHRRVLAVKEAIRVLLLQPVDVPPGIIFALTEVETLLAQILEDTAWWDAHTLETAQKFMLSLSEAERAASEVAKFWDGFDLI